MPTTNLDKTADGSKEDAQQPTDLFRRVKTQPIAAEYCQSAPSPSPNNFCGTKLQVIKRSQVNRCSAHDAPSSNYQDSPPIDATSPDAEAMSNYKHLAAFNAHPPCSPHYKMLSFLIPFVTVSMMFACEQSCAATAIVAGLLAGSTSRIIYGTIKRIRHRH